MVVQGTWAENSETSRKYPKRKRALWEQERRQKERDSRMKKRAVICPNGRGVMGVNNAREVQVEGQSLGPNVQELEIARRVDVR